jgi:hypothetical protein
MSLAGFESSVSPFLALHTTHMLQHLDLSCNRLHSLFIPLEGAALVAFMKEKSAESDRSGSQAVQATRVSALRAVPNLLSLNLHVNMLQDHRELGAIAELKVLRSLSLHGNPLEENFKSQDPLLKAPNGAAPNAATSVGGYRLSIIAKIPWLRELDFVTVTKGERLILTTETNKLSKGALRRRQWLLENGPTPPRHSSGEDTGYCSSTHRLVHTLQRIHVSTAAGELPERVHVKSVIDTGRNQ